MSCLVYGSAGSLTYWLVGRFIDELVAWLVYGSVGVLVGSLIGSWIAWLVGWLIGWLVGWFMDGFVACCWLVHGFVDIMRL